MPSPPAFSLALLIASAQAGEPPRRVEVGLGPAGTAGFVAIPAGRFVMGSPEGEGYELERPAHEVEVGRFYLAEHEVTRAQWTAVMAPGAAPRIPGVGHGMSAQRPAERVSWCDALRLANALSEALPGAEPVYVLEGCDEGAEVRWLRERRGVRLPTEAEWEYATRAGTTTAWWTGDDPTGLAEAAWYAERGSPGIHDVGTKRANPWGLYDVHGNVWEWTWDAWAPYGAEAGDPAVRAVRGGGAWFVAEMARSAFRYPRARDERVVGQGLRLAIDAAVLEEGAR
jgi:formylglycine-generating enzyme required for sulfatase activity